jgi:tetratricopeptide (TPR) repeat protein
MEYFHQRDFRKAMALFDAATNGPVREMAYSARTHLRMCESRLSKSEPEARSAEENYNHGIAQMNLRSFANAAALFEISVKQSETDYAHYALAAALGHQGQVDQAVRHLQRAIQMQPRNRAMAASDPDFIELAKFQPIRDILTGS